MSTTTWNTLAVAPGADIDRRRSAFPTSRFFIDKFESNYDPAPSDSSTALVKCATLTNELEEYSPSEGFYFGDPPFDESASSGGVAWQIVLLRLRVFLGSCVPRATLGNVGACTVATALVVPRMISHLLLYPFCRLVFGTLYPAYASYKAVRTKNLKEYVKWMMYWIVFALFTCAETFTDVFLSWFPFYYEVKIVLVLWLLSPATRGSSILYRKFVHPALSRREQEIDDAISKAKEQGYHTVLNLGSKGVNYATSVIMQTAIRGGGGLVQQLRKSYSLSDLVEDTRPAGGGSGDDAPDEADDVLADPRLIRQSIARSGYNTRRSASESNNRTPIYFSEVDVDVRSTRASTRGDVPDFSHIKSSEDISSGYSSADNSGALREGAAGGGGGSGEGAGLARAGSVGAAARPRTRLATRTVTTIKRPGAAEGSEVVIEELEDNENFDFTDLPPLLNLPSSYHISQTNPPFLFEYVGNQIKIVRMLGDVLPSNAPENNTVRISQNENPVIESCSYKTSMIGGKADFNNKIEAIPENSPIDFPKVIIPIYDRTVKDDVDTNKNDNVVIIEKCLPFVPSSTIEAETIRTSELNELNDTFNHNVECINNSNLMLHCQHSKSVSSSSASLNSAKTTPSVGKDNSGGDGESIETSSLDDIIETDDEGSYGTPENSPRAINKHKKKGKYGKSRAPPPPDVKDDLNEVVLRPINDFSSIKSNDIAEVSISESSYNVKSSEVSSSHGHISKRKYRQKSKSPTGRKFKLSSSPITRLMQLPGKLAFWHKSEDKFKSDTWSTSSDDLNGRSLVGENVGDEFQSCVDLQEATNKAEAGDSGPNEHIPTITVSASLDKHPEETVTNITVSDFDLEESAIAKDIIDKSDVLQKLIEAKLESHPEYKIVPLHGEEIQTTSKSTEV